jgi:Trk K+ transport system NAD-binding subunit
VRLRARKENGFRQQLLIHVNFLRVVLPQFKLSLAVFVSANLLGALVLWSDPTVTTDGDKPLSFLHALYAAVALNFFEVAEEFPQDGSLLTQAVFFLLPAVGLLVVAEGLIRLGVAIVNRKQMSEEWHRALAASFNDHVVIAGLGKIGHRVASRVEKDEQLVCIEQHKPKAELLELSENVAVLFGDATKPQVLEHANLANARAILVLTDNDLANLEIAINAREINPKVRVVLRMFNERLGRRLIETFNFEAVYSTSSLAAPSFSSAIYSNRILQTIQVAEGHAVHMAKLRVDEGSRLVGQSILEVEKLAHVSVVLHHCKDNRELLPSADDQVQAGDELFVLAELKALDACERFAKPQ